MSNYCQYLPKIYVTCNMESKMEREQLVENVYDPVYRDYQWNVDQFWHTYDKVPVKLCAMM